MTDFRIIYNQTEASIPQIPEVTQAEAAFEVLRARLSSTDPELADKIDLAAGALTRAYSMMGFNGALTMGVTA